MPDVLPTFPEVPVQGIRAQLDLIYLFNPDVANDVIDKCNELLEELGELSNISGKIKPYAELEAPVQQYMPTTYGDGLYVANDVINVLPATFNPSQWTLIATKIDRTAITQEINTAVGNEATARAGADNNLQSQIDAISASSDVKDIVGTYAELEDYDTSTLGNNDIIKVLQDETQNDATTYYRWSTTDEQFSLIGSEGPYYTKSQTDVLLGDKQDTLIAGEGITIENNVISSTGGASGDFVPQYETIPTATVQNVGELMQYSGPTIADTKASATAEQTVGSSLFNISVNVKTFEAEEEPTGDETVEFVASVSAGGGFAPQALIQGTEDKYAYFDTAKLIAYIATYTDHTDYKYVSARHRGTDNNDITMWMNSRFSDSSWTNYKQVTGLTDAQMTAAGITFSDYTFYSSNKAQSDYTSSVVTWTKDGEAVMPSSYGITFSGLPVDGDTIEVDYTAFKKGYTQGCFYLSSELRTDPTVGIAQISGGALYDLAVDLDTFVAEEQPTQSENVDFSAVVDTVLGEPTNDYGEPVEWSATLDSNTFADAYEDATGTSIDDLPSYSSFLYNGSDWFLQTDTSISISDPSEWGFYPTGTLYNGSRIGVSRDAPYWTKDSVVVDIADYGITYSGTPEDGDVLRVFYTASTISGYEWKQVNVQPTGEIKWTTNWYNDVTSEYERSIYPVFEALEDGHYVWYCKEGVASENNVVTYQTFKMDFYIRHEGSSPYVSGFVNWIIDGNTNFNQHHYLNYDYVVQFRCNNAKTLFTILGLSAQPRSLTTDKPLFVCSDIENVDTGDTYPVELQTEDPYFNYTMGQINAGPAVDVPINSSISGWNSFSAGDYYGARFSVYDYAQDFIINAHYKDSYFTATIRNIGDSSKKKWIARIDRATGDLSGAYIAQNHFGDQLYVYHNISDPDGNFYAQGTRIGMNVKDQGVWGDYADRLPDGSTIILCTTVNVGSTVTVDNYGIIEQYTGATNGTYTNGYFYKATGTEVLVPESLDPYNTSPDDCTISITNLSGLITAMSNWSGWSESDIRYRLENNNTLFRVYWDAANDVITSVYWGEYGNFYQESGVTDYFTVTTTGSYSGYVNVSAYFQYSPAHTEIQNGYWERVDTQPAADPLPSQTGNTGKFLTTDGTNASWSDLTKVNTTATLAAANWSSNTQTVTVSGMTATAVVFVSPATASQADYTSAGVMCTAQSTDSLTFTCVATPTNDLTVTVVAL